MGTFICPRCQSRYVCDNFNTDFVHECTSEFGIALRDEDIPVTGPWQDYTGSGTEPESVIQQRGLANKLHGTRADIEGAPPLPTFTVRGNSTQKTRTRQHLEYIQRSIKK